MPRQSSGQYVQPANTAAVSGATIGSAPFNTLISDIGQTLTDSVDAKGRTAMQADLPMGGFKATGAANPSAAQDLATKHYVDTSTAAAATYLPAGALQDFAMQTAPTGWLECNGSAVSRTTYPALFAAIGTVWGVGDGSTTFNIPDFRGEFRRGWDNGRGVDPARTFASFQADDFKSHAHGTNELPHQHDWGNGAQGQGLGVGTTGSYSQGGEGTLHTTLATTGITIQSTGGTETRPRNYAVLVCIRT